MELLRKLPTDLWIRLTGIAVLSVLVVWTVSGLGFFRALEGQTLDLRFQLFPTPDQASDSIVIVVLNNDSMERLSWLSWPWPRQMYGQVLDLMRRWGARIVAFDILFELPSMYGTADDSILGASASKLSTVFAVELHSRSHGPSEATTDFPPQALMPLETCGPQVDSALACNPPAPEILRGATILGSTSQRPDPDGVFRRIRVATATPEGIVPSLPLALAWLASGRPETSLDSDGIHLGDRTVRLDEDRRLILRFHGPRETYRYVPIADLFAAMDAMAAGGSPGLDSTVFDGAVVLVGYTAAALMDLKPTPYSAVYPGVEVLATATDNLLWGNGLGRVSGTYSLLLALLVSLLAGIGFAVWRSVTAAAVSGWLVVLLYAAATILAFRQGLWLDAAFPLSSGVLTLLFGGVVSYSHATRQKRMIRRAFSQYLSPDVVREVIESPDKLRLGGEKRVMTAFFSDVQGFTSISEGLDPERLVGLLNIYLTRMADIVMETGGTVDKFEGDAIIAFWGAPLRFDDHARRACTSAVRCQELHDSLNPQLVEQGFPELRTRIGLNTGSMVVGNMGSQKRFDYTMMGEAVNLASRLEGTNKVYGTKTMASSATAEAAGPEFLFRELDTVRVVGQKRPVTIRELLGFRSDASDETLRRLKAYEKALTTYRRGDLKEAAELFSTIPDDPPSRAMRTRCESIMRGETNDYRDGIFILTSK
ncbi:CHASE2 domain-containing protein [Candidatus Fermentibacteria bacterium]|nr:CHASE2 domain-containing protein [Candidatus Fermentibacteria bacterium]